MLEFGFSDSNSIVEFYTYRRAQVVHAVSFDLDNFDIEFVLKNYIESNKDQTGKPYKMDNHICWKTAEGLCFQYSDRTLYVGLSIIKRRY